MAFSISTYITGWALPTTSEKEVKGWLQKWQMQHSQDHENIFNALNSLEKALGNPQYKINMASLSFDPMVLDSANNFMTSNRFQHSEFYGWLNQLGAALSGYGKPPIIVYPVMNITGPIMKLAGDMWALYMQQERITHMITLSAINQIYQAYGV